MRALLDGVEAVVRSNAFWVTWNLLLAFAPWVLAVVLFRAERRRVGVLWWAGVAACIALLPNAAYVLTDVIHVPRLVRNEESDAVVLAAILPMFAALFLLGFLAYVDTLRRMCAFAVARRWMRRTWALELVVHAASAVGIYAGRIHRFNSWDLLTRPVDVMQRTAEGLTRPLPIVGTVFTFVVLAVGYAVMRPVIELATRRADVSPPAAPTAHLSTRR